MTKNMTIGLVAAGTLAILLYASSKKANGAPSQNGNGLPKGSPTPEPSPAPVPDPFRISMGAYCCPPGQNVSGDRCYGADAGGNYVYMGQAKVCKTSSTSTAPSNFVNIFNRVNPSAPAIKCCDSRDKECKCLSWHWSKSSDCKDVPCGGSASNFVNGSVPKNAFNDSILRPAA